MNKYTELFRIQKVCVLIPTYNNAATVGHVIRGVLEYTDQIIVVNDGSTDSTEEILAAFPHVEIVSYAVNKGKGFALRQGFKRAIEKDFEFAISIDSDGQHFAADLPQFIDALVSGNDGLIIGERNMNQSSVPGKSNFGRNFSNFWFTFETGIKLNDTQSGYRLYPVRQLKDVKFITSKFEFEIEVLVRAAWAGIPISEVPVKVFYPEKEQRITHFRPFRDFTRISILNTILVTITLLYIKPRAIIRSIRGGNFWRDLKASLANPAESDMRKAVSVSFGVFMGIVPIWGFQLVTAIALAFILRLNKALVIVAANISIPPMIPLILYLSHRCGSVWMGDKAVEISFDKTLTVGFWTESLMQYVLGAVTLAVVSAIFSGIITYTLVRMFRRS